MRSISQNKGAGSLNHNNRTFACDNVDYSRIKNNVILKQEDLGAAYHKCFDNAIDEYNLKQKRNDRKLDKDYFKHLFGVSSNSSKAKNVLQAKTKEKSFYEELTQIGDMNDTGVINNPTAAERAKKALAEYYQSFVERNTQFYVFNAVIHMDEATPNMHIDYIPLGTDYKRGMNVQNSYDRAIKQMGFIDDANSTGFQKWRENERNVFYEICQRYGLDPKPREMEQGRGYTYTPEQYRKLMREAEGNKKETERYLQESQQIQDSAAQSLSMSRTRAKRLDDKESKLNSKENELAEREKALQLKEMQIELEVRKRVSERITLQNKAENVYNRELPFDDIDYRNPRN